MNKFSVLALVALSAMAGIASSQNPALNTCVALAGGMGSTKSTMTGTSATVCYYSDAACATSADTLCGQMRTMAGEGASACKDGCLSASAVTNTNTNTNTETKTETPALNTCVAIAGMGSTKSTTTGTSATVCYYSDAACATSNDALCGQMRTAGEASGQSYSACKDGCLSASAVTNTNTNTNTNTETETNTNTNTETKTETNSGGTNSGGTSQSGASDGSTEGTGSNQPPAGAEGGSTQGTASNHDDASHDGHAGHDDGADVTNSPVATVDVQAAGHSEKEGGGDMFASLSAAEQKELGVGGKGDKCNGFKLFLASEAANKKCEAFDTKTACEAGGCKYEGSKCDPTAATMMEVMGVEMDQEKMQAEMAAKVKGAKTLEDRMKIQKDMLKKYAKSMVPVMNDMNATMVEIAKFMKRCGGGKTKAACAADKVCELQLAFNASTDNFTQQCNVNKAKAVEETGCSGVAKRIAVLDAIERKAVAAGAKKALAGKQEKQTAAKKAVTDYKEANPTATADTDNALKALETQAASADAEVIAASATVTTADAEATAAEQKAAATPEDSSTLRALPSIMAVVAATVAAAFA